MDETTGILAGKNDTATFSKRSSFDSDLTLILIFISDFIFGLVLFCFLFYSVPFLFLFVAFLFLSVWFLLLAWFECVC